MAKVNMEHTSKGAGLAILRTAVICLFLLALASCGNSAAPTGSSSGFNLSASSITFSFQSGIAPAPANPQQALTVSSSSGGTIAFNVVTDQAWLVAMPGNASTPATITVTATPGSLSAGTYTGNITLKGGSASATVPVTLTVLAAPTGPVMDVSPTSLSFSAYQGGTNPDQQLFKVTNTNGTSQPADMTITIAASQTNTSGGATWLTAGPATGSAPQSVQVNVAVGTLPANTYSGTVTISSTTTPTAINSPWTVPITFTVLPAPPSVEIHPDLRRGVIYQIVTDRFFDGDSTNDNPVQSPNLYDPGLKDWQLYWGGDLNGIQKKIAYLQSLGVSAIWISPPVDNVNQGVVYSGTTYAPYHGYWARDFKRIEEHFGDVNNTWAAFDSLVSAAHAAGIKVIVDFAANHTSPISGFPTYNASGGEDGALYNNGIYVTTYSGDTGSCATSSTTCFHHNPTISNYSDRYQLQYYTLADLADLNQENPWVDQYLKDALTQFIQHGVNGFRLDKVKHVTWGWEYTLANSAETQYSQQASPLAQMPPFLFGEWQEEISDTLYSDSVKFANQSGISLLDYPLYWDVANAFATGGSFTTVDSDISTEAGGFASPNDLVTFVDNHDNPRLLSQGATQNQLNEALVFELTCRGIPIVYYGDEQYLHNDTNNGSVNGGVPYDRPQMTTFDPTVTGAKVVRYMAALRSKNLALAYGTMQQRWINNDVYVYERQFNSSVVLVAINKNETTAQALSGPWNTALPDGTYADYLGGMLGGVSVTVSGGAVANNAVTLPAHSVSVWQVQGAGTAQAGALTPTRGQAGTRVAITGTGFGASRGTGWVQVGGVGASSYFSWADDTVVFTVPGLSSGTYAVTLAPNGGSAIAAPETFTVLGAAQIPVTITATGLPAVPAGDQVMITGNVVELGSGSMTFQSAVGPMLLPSGGGNYFITTSLPAGAGVQFQFFILASNGTVYLAGGTTNSYTVPSSGEGTVTGSW